MNLPSASRHAIVCLLLGSGILLLLTYVWFTEDTSYSEDGPDRHHSSRNSNLPTHPHEIVNLLRPGEDQDAEQEERIKKLYLPSYRHPHVEVQLTDGQYKVYVANQALISFPDLSDDISLDLTNTEFKLKSRLSGTSFVITWNYDSSSSWEEMTSRLSLLYPGAIVEKDCFLSKASFPESEDGKYYHEHLGVTYAWENNLLGDKVVIGLLDTGVKLDLPDLQVALFTNDADPVDGLDNDKNGFVDDFQGWDIIESDNIPQDKDAHGTGMAALIGADGSNNQGMIGVAQGARIIPIRMLDEFGLGTISEAAKAINYARKRGVDIINASWGTDDGDFFILYKAIEEFLEDNDRLFITAAGNDGHNLDNRPTYPAAYEFEGMLTIGAYNSILEDFERNSNFGKENVDFLGPFRPTTYTSISDTDSTISIAPGTSSSTALITGVVAVVRSNRMDLRRKDLIRQLRASSTLVPKAVLKADTPGIPNIEAFMQQKTVPAPVLHGITVSPSPYAPGEWLQLNIETNLQEGDFTLRLDGKSKDLLLYNDFNYQAPDRLGDPLTVFATMYSVTGISERFELIIEPTFEEPFISEGFDYFLEASTAPAQVEVPIRGLYNIDARLRAESGKEFDIGWDDVNRRWIFVPERTPFGAGKYTLQLSFNGNTDLFPYEITWKNQGYLAFQLNVEEKGYQASRINDLHVTEHGYYAYIDASISRERVIFSENGRDWKELLFEEDRESLKRTYCTGEDIYALSWHAELNKNRVIKVSPNAEPLVVWEGIEPRISTYNEKLYILHKVGYQNFSLVEVTGELAKPVMENMTWREQYRVVGREVLFMHNDKIQVHSLDSGELLRELDVDPYNMHVFKDSVFLHSDILYRYRNGSMQEIFVGRTGIFKEVGNRLYAIISYPEINSERLFYTGDGDQWTEQLAPDYNLINRFHFQSIDYTILADIDYISGETGQFSLTDSFNWTEYDYSEEFSTQRTRGISIYRRHAENSQYIVFEDPIRLPERFYDTFPWLTSYDFSGWFEDPTLGWFFISGQDSYVFSQYHGWIYFIKNEDQAWLYNEHTGWLYYDDSLYPYFYAENNRSWLYYLDGSHHPRWFYNVNEGVWFSLD